MKKKKLMPEIIRKRAYFEGIYSIKNIDEKLIKIFLLSFSKEIGMRQLSEIIIFSPNNHSDLHHGIGGFMSWIESGCSIYTWDEKNFFTVEMYTCKDFDINKSKKFISKFFKTKKLICNEVS